MDSPNQKYDVSCIGLIAVNFPVRAVDPSVFDADVTLVDPIEITTGGDAANQAVVLSRLGKRVLLAGKVGDDQSGRFIVENVRANGVDTGGVVLDRKSRTSTCVVLIRSNGSRNFLSNRDANEKLSLDDIDVSTVLNARAISLGSMLAIPKLDGPPCAELLREAKRRGCLTFADTKHDTYRIGFDGIRRVLSQVDYFLPSYEEARQLTGESDPHRAADAFMSAGAANVIVKLGQDGCLLRTPNQSKFIEGFPVKVVDSTGAGDNFVGGFLGSILDGRGVEESCVYANAVGAISVTEMGATAALEGREQVKEFLERFGR